MTRILSVAGALYVALLAWQGWDAARWLARDQHQSPFGAYPIRRYHNYDVQRLAMRLGSLSRPEDAYAAINLGPRDSVAILSHDAKLDEPAIVGALRAGCRYVGAIGSRKTQAGRRDRLLAAGLTDADLDRLHGPIGLPLGGRAPAEVALAILAEIVSERNAKEP